MIRLAKAEDLDFVAESYVELLTFEQEHGRHSNWVLNVYPTRQTAQTSWEAGTLYVLWEDGQLCASMILNQVQPVDYAQIPWSIPAREEEVFVIHTLCIPPAKAGKGYGRQMVQYALEQAKARGCKAVRLDTYAGNEPAAAFYQKLGFRYAGRASVLFQGQIPEEQIFFEKEP